MREARRLGVPIVALVDTNCDPDEADYIIPGNDDAIRSCSLIVRAIADGIAAGQSKVTERELTEMAGERRDGERPPSRRLEPSGRRRAGEPSGWPRRRAGRARGGRPRATGSPSGRGRRASRRGARRRRVEARPRRPRRRAREHDDPRNARQGAPRRDRRGDDGLQARARGDGRRPRSRAHAPARARAWPRPRSAPAARRPRASSATASTDGRRHDGRRRLRDRAGLEERRVPGVREAACSRPSTRTGPKRSTTLEQERVELIAKLGENIVVIGAERYEAGDGEVAERVHAPAGEQDRRPRQARGRHEELARQLAMHISFAAPEWIDARGRSGRGGRGRAAGLPQLGRARRASRSRRRRRSSRACSRSASSPRSPAACSPTSRGSTTRRRRWVRRSQRPGRVSWRSSASLSQNRRRDRARREETERAPPTGAAPAFRRVLLKLSGEALMGEPRVRDRPEARRGDRRARSSSVQAEGLELAIVVGGGNIYRGMAAAAERDGPRDRPTTPACSRPS